MPELPDGPTEESTERDGAFSYAGEWHAFAIGFAVGIASVTPVKRQRQFVWRTIGIDADTATDAMREARKESWYAVGGMALGMMWGVLLWSSILAAFASQLGYL